MPDKDIVSKDWVNEAIYAAGARAGDLWNLSPLHTGVQAVERGFDTAAHAVGDAASAVASRLTAPPFVGPLDPREPGLFQKVVSLLGLDGGPSPHPATVERIKQQFPLTAAAVKATQKR